jgi:hypothetical protein
MWLTLSMITLTSPCLANTISAPKETSRIEENGDQDIAPAHEGITAVTQPSEAQGASESLDSGALVRDVERIDLSDTDITIGPHNQPIWTIRRVFQTAIAYINPEGTLNGEFRTRVRQFRDERSDEKSHEFQFQEYIEYGLPYRLHLDIAFNQKNTLAQARRLFDREGEQLGIRWAIAEWGDILFNPTIAFYYNLNKDQPETGEVKLLLSETLAPNVHAAANLSYRESMWKLSKERILSTSFGLGSTAFVDSLSIGAEVRGDWIESPAQERKQVFSWSGGPSLHWRPRPTTHISFAALMGVQKEAPKLESFVVIGHNFK